MESLFLFPLRISKRWRWFIAGFYWIVLTLALLSVDPWTIFGGVENVQPVMDPAKSTPSFMLHFGAYLVLGILVGWAVLANLSRWRGWLFLVGLHSLFTEVAQVFIPYRFANVMDVVANMMGVALAFGVLWGYLLWYRYSVSIESSVPSPPSTGTQSHASGSQENPSPQSFC